MNGTISVNKWPKRRYLDIWKLQNHDHVSVFVMSLNIWSWSNITTTNMVYGYPYTMLVVVMFDVFCATIVHI